VARKYSAILGLLALSVSLLRGVLAGGGTDTVLWTAWYQFLTFAVLGGVIGWLAQRIIEDSVNGRIAAEVEEQKKTKASQPAAAGAAAR